MLGAGFSSTMYCSPFRWVPARRCWRAQPPGGGAAGPAGIADGILLVELGVNPPPNAHKFSHDQYYFQLKARADALPTSALRFLYEAVSHKRVPGPGKAGQVYSQVVTESWLIPKPVLVDIWQLRLAQPAVLSGHSPGSPHPALRWDL